MDSVLICIEDQKVHDQVRAELGRSSSGAADIYHLKDRGRLLEYLRYEIPDLVFLYDAPDNPELISLLEKIKKDPWLETVGFVLITPQRHMEEELLPLRGYNIMYFLPSKYIERDLFRILSILNQDTQLLNYSSLIKNMADLSGVLEINNDLLQVGFYAQYFANYLFKEGYIDTGKKYSVQLALSELLTNAIEHGNAGITAQEKANYLAQGRRMTDVVKAKLALPSQKDKKVHLSYKIGKAKTTFTIKDEGDGFDTAALMSSLEVPDYMNQNGRGILLTMGAVDQVTYNKIGNKVTIVIEHNGQAERTIPTGFVEGHELELKKGDIVFSEGESSDSLFYIVSGSYDVCLEGKILATLNPRDIFLGEMSFLLGNKRSATIKAGGKGRLIEIDRKVFFDAINANPNYSIFLSKLLAKRLKTANKKIVQLERRRRSRKEGENYEEKSNYTIIN